MFDQLSDEAVSVLISLGILIGSVFVGMLLDKIIFSLLNQRAKKKDSVLLRSIVNNLREPSDYLIPAICLMIGLYFTTFTGDTLSALKIIFRSFIYIFGSWFLVQIVDVVSEILREHYNMEQEDNLEERKILTQLQFVKRLASVIIGSLAVAFILLQFESVRQVGAGLLTSAGVAGIIIGFAAQKSIANLLAGFQIAFTQPIRIDDVVIVENEWGKIEEITLTYVVIRIWDQRRLIVPLNYFIEKPFQNWTRQTAELLGTVFIYADYRLPLTEIRQKLDEILENNTLWDRRVKVVQITNSTEQTMEVRVLVSARNASEAFDLRCIVREELITFIQNNYPDSLPRTRVEMPFKEAILK